MLCLSPAEAAKRAPAGVQEAFGPDPCRILGKSFFWGLSPLGKAISDKLNDMSARPLKSTTLVLTPNWSCILDGSQLNLSASTPCANVCRVRTELNTSAPTCVLPTEISSLSFLHLCTPLGDRHQADRAHGPFLSKGNGRPDIQHPGSHKEETEFIASCCFVWLGLKQDCDLKVRDDLFIFKSTYF